MSDRARQFLPFDALKGFNEATRKVERIKVDKIELSEEEYIALDRLVKQLKPGMIVEVVYFDDNEYIYVNGIISKIDLQNRYIMIVKTKILFDDLLRIKCNEIKDYSFDW